MVLVVVVDEELVVVGVVLRVVLVVVVDSVGGDCAGTVTVVVLPPHPANARPTASARAANAASGRLMTPRRERAGAARSKDSR